MAIVGAINILKISKHSNNAMFVSVCTVFKKYYPNLKIYLWSDTYIKMFDVRRFSLVSCVTDLYLSEQG